MSQVPEQEGKFMVAVGAMIRHSATGQILLLKRSGATGYAAGIWEDIGGRMKQFEEPEEALRREVREESGLEIQIVKPLTIIHEYRGAQTAENEMVIIVYLCTTDSDEVVVSEEHTAYRWLSPLEALELVEHPGVRRDIEALIEETG